MNKNKGNLVLIIIIGGIILYFASDGFKLWINGTVDGLLNKLNGFLPNDPKKDKYALEEGYHVRYISNSNLNHAFNGVNVNGSWIEIEPQSAESGLNRSPLVSNRFPNYNPAYNTTKKQM